MGFVYHNQVSRQNNHGLSTPLKKRKFQPGVKCRYKRLSYEDRAFLKSLGLRVKNS